MRLIMLAATLWAALLAAAPASDIEPALADVLVHDLRFSEAEFAQLRRGAIVRHSLGAEVVGEAALVGAVRVNARRDVLLANVRDIEKFKQSPDVLAVGRFSVPPRIEDLASLTLETRDFDMRDCRVNDCDLRLPAGVISRFQRDIDWRAPDADARAAALYKQVLVEHVRAYMSGTTGQFAEYNGGSRPIRPIEDFAGVLKNSTYVGSLSPGLPAHLASFPAAALPGAEDFVYWSKEKFGLRPFVTITHVTITPITSGTDVITSKGLYASRYLDASLGLTIASEATDGSGAFYIVYANRFRASLLKGGFSGLRRMFVERRGRGTIEENLKATRERLERQN